MAHVAGHLSLAELQAGYRSERGRDAGAALPGDLAAGAGAELRGDGGAHELRAALGGAAARALQRLRAVEPRRPAARQRRARRRC